MRASSASDKNYFIGRFVTGLPGFSKKKNDNKWSLQKEGLQGRQITDTLRVYINFFKHIHMNIYNTHMYCFSLSVVKSPLLFISIDRSWVQSCIFVI